MSKLIDISGNGNNGTINGALLTKDGMKFNSVASNVSLTYPNTMTGNITLCSRFKLNSYGFGASNIGMLFSNSKFIVYTYATGTSIRFARNGAGPEIVNVIPLNKWVDYCIVSGSDGVSNIYIDGVLAGSFTATVLAGSTTCYIGNLLALNWGLDGEIADFKIYNRLFTTKEIQNYHNSFIKPTLIDSMSDYAVGDTL